SLLPPHRRRRVAQLPRHAGFVRGHGLARSLALALSAWPKSGLPDSGTIGWPKSDGWPWTRQAPTGGHGSASRRWECPLVFFGCRFVSERKPFPRKCHHALAVLADRYALRDFQAKINLAKALRYPDLRVRHAVTGRL